MISGLMKEEPIDEKWMITPNTVFIMLHFSDIVVCHWGRRGEQWSLGLLKGNDS